MPVFAQMGMLPMPHNKHFVEWMVFTTFGKSLVSNMKWRFVLLSILLLSAQACDRSIDIQLDRIERELNDDPYAAYTELAGMDSGTMSKSSHRARYALLMSLAMDKSYVDVANDSLVQIAVRYYERHKDLRRRMLSMYSLARVQRNAGENAEAVISFLQAKELTERLSEKHYYGLVTRNMAELYLSCHDYERGQAYYRESAKAFNEIGSTYYASYSVLGEAETMMAMGLYNDADSLFRSLEMYARDKQKSDVLSFVLKDRAMIEMKPERRNPKKAISLLRESEEKGFPPSTVGEYGTLALAFAFLQKTDSVLKYEKLAEEQVKTCLDSIHLCNFKYRLYNHRKRFDLANQYLEQGVKLHIRQIYDRQNHLLANTISVYNQEEANKVSVVARLRLILLVISVIAILSLLFIIIQIIIARRHQLQEKNREIKEIEQKLEEEVVLIQDISEQLRNVQETHSEMAKTINDLISERIAIVKICADAYDAVTKETRPNPRDPYRHLDEDPMKKKTEELNRFVQAMNDLRRDDELFRVLEESVNKWRNGIMFKLRESFSKDYVSRPRFSEEDFRVVMLVYAGIPDRAIAFLMNLSYAAVRTRKTRYKERLAQSDIENGVFFIQEMA